MRTALFTIVSPNYRAFARVLMASARRHHPDWEQFVLVVDPEPPAWRDDESFHVVPLAALELPSPRQFCFRYTMLELNTAVKPWMFHYLFGREFDRVVYLDPDIEIYSPLVELDDMPADTFITLTPHVTGPIGGDEHPSERSILQAGAYNLGFIEVRRRPPLNAFLSWWKARLEHHCVVDLERGLFVDQKWMDLAPGLFPGVRVLRHDGYNVAYWNLAQRTVRADAGGYVVNGEPLRFFHFSGYDPGLSGRVSRHHHSLRLDEVGEARRVIDAYGAAVKAAGHASFRSVPYGFGHFANGSRISDSVRVAYRRSEEIREAAGADPFAHAELFAAIPEEPERAEFLDRAGRTLYRLLSRPRSFVKLFPEDVRRSMRERLLGRRERPPRRLH